MKEGHCNGTRHIVKNISPHFIKATKLDGGDAENATVFIPKIPMKSKESDFPVLFTRLQFPVIGGHCLTFNRAQGQSLDHSGLLLPQSVFSHGHLYVGLSRTGDPKNVHVFANQDEFHNLAHALDVDKKCHNKSV